MIEHSAAQGRGVRQLGATLAWWPFVVGAIGLLASGIALGRAGLPTTAEGSERTPGPRSGPQSFIFDGSPRLSPGLNFEFSRGVPTLDDAGNAVAADVARYAGKRLLCGAPEIRTVAGTTFNTSFEMLTAGVLADGTTPVWITQDNNRGLLSVIVGTETGPKFTYNRVSNPAKGGLPDFLRESIDESPDEAWSPRAALVCHGMAIVFCNVAVRDSHGDFFPNRVGFATCNLADLDGPKNLWWRRHAYSDVLTPWQVNLGIGATWSMRQWYSLQRDGSAPTEFWVCAADYRAAPAKDGGVYCVFPVTRPSAADSHWTPGSVVELPGRFSSNGNGLGNVTHAHALAAMRFGTDGILALGSRGDGLYSNANYTWTLDHTADYALGASPAPGSLGWLTGPTAWSGPKIVHGSILPPSADPSLRALGNQWIGNCPAPVEGRFLVGCDEVSQALWMTSPLTSDPATVDFTTTYPASPTAWFLPNGATSSKPRYIMFHISTPTPNTLGGQYVAQLSPSQFDNQQTLSQRILYSPDGFNWGQCWAHRENSQSGPMIADGRIYVGAQGSQSLLGLRSIPVPSTRIQKPLRLALGGTNLLSSPIDVSGVGGNTTVVPEVLSTISSPPATGPIFRVTTAPTAAAPDAFIGRFALAAALPMPNKALRLRCYVRGTPSGEGGTAGTLSINARLRSTDANNAGASPKFSAWTDGIALPGTGDWIPLVFSTDVSTWGTQPALVNLDLEVQSNVGVCLPGSFLLAFDSLTMGEPTPYPLPQNDTGPSEIATVTGMNLDGDFTVLLGGLLPMDSWDRVAWNQSNLSRPLCSIISQSGNRWIEVAADPITSEIVLSFFNNGAITDQTQIFDTFFTPGSPVLLALRYEAASNLITLRASACGATIAAATLDTFELDGPVTAVRFGPGRGTRVTPLDWFGGLADGRAWSNAEIDTSLKSLAFLTPPPCRADFNSDGFVTGDDFDAYVTAFEAGDASADFDSDGFVTGDDFDAYVVAFESGC